jgi:hypothetical protein
VIHLYRRRLAACVLSSVRSRLGRHITLVIASRRPSPSPAWPPVSAAARHGLSCALWLVHPPLKARESYVVVTFIVFPSSFLVLRAKAALLRSTKPGRVGFARCLCSVRARVCQRFSEQLEHADRHVASISSLAFDNLVRLSHCHLCLCCTSPSALSRIRTIQQTTRLQEINTFRKDLFVPPSKRKTSA